MAIKIKIDFVDDFIKYDPKNLKSITSKDLTREQADILFDRLVELLKEDSKNKFTNKD